MKCQSQERHSHLEGCITVKVSRRRQNIEKYLAKEDSGVAFFSTVLGHTHTFASKNGNEFGVMMREKRPQDFEFT